PASLQEQSSSDMENQEPHPPNVQEEQEPVQMQVDPAADPAPDANGENTHHVQPGFLFIHATCSASSSLMLHTTKTQSLQKNTKVKAQRNLMDFLSLWASN